MRRKIADLWVACVMAVFLSPSLQGQTLYDEFTNPSKSAGVRVWWHWMNGNITKDGIYKDLHWMHDAGIVGFHNFDAGLETPQIVEHRVPYMTPEWKEMFRYALDVADSLGMEVTIASSPGWSETGGPWVTDDEAMKKLVWRQVDVCGDGKTATSITLPEGFSCQGNFLNDTDMHWDTDLAKNYYRDIAVLAVKLSDSDVDFKALAPKITSNLPVAGMLDYDSLNSDSVSDGVTLHTDADGTAWVQYEFSIPQTIKAVVVSDRKNTGDVYATVRTLMCSDDGVNFREAATLGYQSTIQKTYSIPATTGRFFRLQISDTQKLKECGINLYQFMLSSVARIQDAGDKGGFGFYRLLYAEDTVPDDTAASTDDVVDLTASVRDGRIEWTVPEGRWRIFRFGYSLTGKTNHPASPEATGLEVDKIDRNAVSRYLNNYLQTYQDASGGRLGPEGISYMLTDSYEAGPQTWTVRMSEEFKTRKGYDLLKWMPALTGMVLGSTAETERFLFDWRTCIGEMIAEYHYDIQNEVLSEYGMKRYTESHENFRANLSDGMDCKRLADVPMSAFWMTRGFGFTPRFEADIRESASVAHIYGQNIAAAESFTSDGFRDGAWIFPPSVLKIEADAAMASGLNRFIIHCSTHQPVDDRIPGLGLGKYGQWFTRHQTWASQACSWTDYLSRSCELLQKGRFVADIAVYYGEDNNVTGIYLKNRPDIPEGYNFDYFSPSVLMDVATPHDGVITTPSGMEYRVLSLGPNVKNMSVKVLRRIKEYADAGVSICGVIPSNPAGLEGTEEEFRALVKDIWYSGRANVRTDSDAASLLKDVGEDVSVRGGMDGLSFVHRKLSDGDIYWMANRTDRTLKVDASFRVAGKKPEIWHAEDASVESVSYSICGGRTDVPLELTPYQSFFVVFLEDALHCSETVLKTDENELLTIDTPWKVTFQEKRGAPESIRMDVLTSLSENDDPGVRYFSGAVTYSNSFTLSARAVKGGKRILLDLGQVSDIAEITVNGLRIGVAWHTPYKIDITSAVKKGVNSLEVKVYNTWHNRIVGDMRQDAGEKVTWYPMELLTPDTPLLPSGMTGPVKVLLSHN